MKLILLRHGDHFDDNLTIKGVKQAVEAGGKLFEQKLTTIYCSPSQRTEQTMDEVLRVRNDQIPISFSRLIAPKMKAESYEELKRRIQLFLDDLKYDFEQNDSVLVVSHMAVIRMIHLLVTGNDRLAENAEVIEIDYSK